MKRFFCLLITAFALNVSTFYGQEEEAPTFWMHCDDKVFTTIYNEGHDHFCLPGASAYLFRFSALDPNKTNEYKRCI
jgi:hypothetical protein